ncbi:uncharacterized protein LODBEIA_P36750 [Lodderomyces beijingensis]|uniref:Uncharacterized protein n=1 Tax=Lodderomyces beijingensis TaxID=1775926 RepID=A0ABP0ZRC0_9ASCO
MKIVKIYKSNVLRYVDQESKLESGGGVEARLPKRRKVDEQESAPQDETHLFSRTITIEETSSVLFPSGEIPEEVSFSVGVTGFKHARRSDDKFTISWCAKSSTKQFPIVEFTDCEGQVQNELQLVRLANPRNGMRPSVSICLKTRGSSVSLTVAYKLDYFVNFKNAVTKEISNLLSGLLFSATDSAEESGSVSAESFYSAVYAHTEKMPPFEDDFDIPELETTLLKFQKKTVNWMLSMENARYNSDDSRCTQVPFVTKEDLRNDEKVLSAMNKLSPGWKGPIAFNNQELYFNAITGHISTMSHLCSFLENYLSSEDKSQYPTVLPAKGLLCEEMGLGKTVESAATILLNQRPLQDVDQRVKRPLSSVGDYKMVIKSRATLIIAPVTIIKQWQEEILRLAPSLSIIEYTGVSSYKMFNYKPAIIAEYLNKFDIVFATYSVISKELDYAKFSNNLRKTRAARKDSLFCKEPTDLTGHVEKIESSRSDAETIYYSLKSKPPPRANIKSSDEQPFTDYEQALQDEIALSLKHNEVPDWYQAIDYACPLMLMEFWRLILDEVQMVSSSMTRAFQSAQMIPRFHSWGVSGTPIQKDLNDLYSYLKFLQFYPFDSNIGDLGWYNLTSNYELFKQFWSTIAIRHTKAMVRNDIRLPAQNRILLTIPFTPIEQEFYDEKFAEFSAAIGLDREGNPLGSDFETTNLQQTMRSWLRRLRQICCSPQVGMLEMSHSRPRKSRLHDFVEPLESLEKLLDDMLTRSYGEVTEKERRQVELVSQLCEFLEFIYRPQDAIKYLKSGIIETRKIIRRLEVVLGKYLQDFRNDASGSNSERKDDDEIGRIGHHEQPNSDESHLESKISSIRLRLRNWLVTLHKFYFLFASANFQLYDKEFQSHIEKYRVEVDLDSILEESFGQYKGDERADELASVVSSVPMADFKHEEKLDELMDTPQENETKFYELAEQIRALILKQSLEQLGKALRERIFDRTFYTNWDQSLVDEGLWLLPKTSKRFFNVLPTIKIAELEELALNATVATFIRNLKRTVEPLNKNASELNSGFKELVDLLSEKVTEKSTNPDDNEYDNGLKNQEAIASSLSSLGEKLVERNHLILGQTDVISKPGSTFNSQEPIFSDLIAELGSIEYDAKESANASSSAEAEVIQAIAQRVRTIFENQKLAFSLFNRELNVHCNSIFNLRVDYYRQLQQISDSVAAPKYDPFDRKNLRAPHIEAQLRKLTRTFERTHSSMDSMVARLRYLSELVKESNAEGKENVEMLCIICQSGITVGSLTTCGHKFCRECLDHWIKNSQQSYFGFANRRPRCPMCNTAIDHGSVYNFSRYESSLKGNEIHDGGHQAASGLHGVYKGVEDYILREIEDIKLKATYSSKIDMIVKQVLYLRSKDPSVQIIIFSQWQDMLYILSSALRAAKVTFLTFDGESSNRTRSKRRTWPGAVELFKDPSNGFTCFLLNANAQSSGLTLVNATHIFLCEPLLNTSLELQAISRIHRIGQRKPTTVWMFAIENTVEENIVVTSTNKRLKLLHHKNGSGHGHHDDGDDYEYDNDDIDGGELNERDLVQADSLSVMSNIGIVSHKQRAEGEVVTDTDLWDGLFSKKSLKHETGRATATATATSR